MSQFVYNVPVKVYFGENQIHHLKDELKKHGKRILLCYGGGSIKKSGLYDAVVKQIKDAGLYFTELSGIEPNPRVESVREGARLCKENAIDLMLAVGGGSTLDAAKWICAAACADFDAWDFFSKNAAVEAALPLITVLTLSATGSEMNAGGVISNMQTQDKLGRGDSKLLPKVSFLDPSNTYSVSPYQTACGSADIISHILEVYFSPVQDLYMLDCMMEGLLKTVIKYAPIAMQDPQNYEARANLMWASSWAINGFIWGSKEHAWSCHPMEHVLSAFYDITHGHGLAILTPRWLTYSLHESNADKYVQFGVNVFGIDKNLPKMEIAKRSIDMLSEFFFKTLGLKSTFAQVGILEKDIPAMAEKACFGGVINGFVPLDKKAIEAIYNMCL